MSGFAPAGRLKTAEWSVPDLRSSPEGPCGSSRHGRQSKREKEWCAYEFSDPGNGKCPSGLFTDK